MTTNTAYACLIKKLKIDINEYDNLSGNGISYILDEAEKIAHSYKNTENTDAVLAPIFTHINGEHGGFFISPENTGKHIKMPVNDKNHNYAECFSKAGKSIRTYLSQYPINEDFIGSFLTLCESEFSFLPSDNAEDISCYDDAKITCALGSCISEYIFYNKITDVKAYFDGDKFRSEKAFLLYSADLSGIQNFIYTISTEKALRSLRSRSFFLNLMMEHYVDELLGECGLSRANLLYSGGGHCYIILPNTSDVKEKLEKWNSKFNQFLIDEFQSALFLGHGYTECSADELINYPAEESPYKAMFRRVSSMISAHKMHRYSAEQLIQLNKTHLGGERECKVCGRTDHITQNDRCEWCDCFVDLSYKIQEKDVFIVSRECKNSDFKLPAFSGDAYFTFTDDKDIENQYKSGENIIRIYTKNKSLTEYPHSTRLFVGDYKYDDNSMENLVDKSQGIKRMGVCRMDVDNLGQAFVAGFEVPGTDNSTERYKYVNIARTSAFSRQMSMFFQYYINDILSGGYKNTKKLAVLIVYSGGDDVFLVGAWNDVLEAANRIQQAFTEYTCGTLTISAGFGMFGDTFPIKVSAEYTAELEDRAKSEPGKSSISLFSPYEEHTYSWETYREKIVDEKIKVLTEYFSNNTEHGKNFLYNLLNLLRPSLEDDGRINLARYAYQLARLQPKQSSPEYEGYREFKDCMYKWAMDITDRKQLITAIYIYVYLNREA